jgi:Rrf2 family protein
MLTLTKASKEISDVFGMPNELLAKVLQRLGKTGLLKAHQGRGGGYSLARPVGTISVTDVIEAVEGPIAVSVCLKGGSEEHCEQFDYCNIKSPVEQVQDRLIELFNSISVDQITEDILECPEKTYLSSS